MYNKEKELITMTIQQKEELWFLLLDWKEDILDESIRRNVHRDSIDELIEKIEKIIEVNK